MSELMKLFATSVLLLLVAVEIMVARHVAPSKSRTANYASELASLVYGLIGFIVAFVFMWKAWT